MITDDIFQAAQAGDKDEVKRHLKTGTLPGAVDDQRRWSPLHYAASEGHLELITLLLSRGADIAQTCRLTGATPLHVAAYHGQVDAALRLIQHGASVTPKTFGGDTPLHAAGLSDTPELIPLLMSHHAPINQPNVRGETPLHLAACYGSAPTVAALLSCPDMRHFMDDQGKLPMDVASSATVRELLQSSLTAH